ncbi:MAG: TIM barrel protein [Candidatus Woesearchaeota archaeon]
MIRLGPAGVDGDAFQGLRRIHDMGLNAVEIEFTHGVSMKNDKAMRVGELARTLGIEVSVHCPYFINLLSDEKEKITASRKRILDSCERGHYLGAGRIVFHPGFYGKRTKKESYDKIKEEIINLMQEIKKNKWSNIVLSPETTGKPSQFGDLDELLMLSRETGCQVTVDFAHLYARSQGTIKFSDVFDKISHFKHIHSHFSGIEFGEKGERRHLVMDKSFFLPIAKEIIKRKLNITLISESPVTWKDSLKMKEVLENLK